MTETQEAQFACKECDRRVLKSQADLLQRMEPERWGTLSFLPSRFRSFEELQAVKLCQVCWEHQGGLHTTNFRSNCLECQVEKKKFSQKLTVRLEDDFSRIKGGVNEK